MKVHAFMLVPISKLARASQALTMASCARSSAAVGSPVSERANARSCGISATSSALKTLSRAGSAAAFPPPSVIDTVRIGPFGRLTLVCAAKQVEKVVGHRFVDHLVEKLAKTLSDSAFVDTTFARINSWFGWFLH